MGVASKSRARRILLRVREQYDRVRECLATKSNAAIGLRSRPKMVPERDKSAGLPIWTRIARPKCQLQGCPPKVGALGEAFALLMGQALAQVHSNPGPTDYKSDRNSRVNELMTNENQNHLSPTSFLRSLILRGWVMPKRATRVRAQSVTDHK